MHKLFAAECKWIIGWKNTLNVSKLFLGQRRGKFLFNFYKEHFFSWSGEGINKLNQLA